MRIYYNTGHCVEIRYLNTVVYVPRTPSNLTYDYIDLDDSLIPLLLSAVFGSTDDWQYAGLAARQTPQYTQSVIWDNDLEQPAYVLFSQSGRVLCGFKHVDALRIESYKSTDRMDYTRDSLAHWVLHYDTSRDYITLM